MSRQSFNRKAVRSSSIAWLLLACSSLAVILLSTAHSAQDNRQLQRDSTQQAGQPGQRRIALVIGNGAYTNAPPLKNPPNDARDMAATLKARLPLVAM